MYSAQVGGIKWMYSTQLAPHQMLGQTPVMHLTIVWITVAITIMMGWTVDQQF